MDTTSSLLLGGALVETLEQLLHLRNPTHTRACWRLFCLCLLGFCFDRLLFFRPHFDPYWHVFDLATFDLEHGRLQDVRGYRIIRLLLFLGRDDDSL
jgi:hypothetical protein